ncbi:MAG TPA: ThiF family adenylyltransferase, partial [Planctomycetota bacterium]|nr:ThiF family adenylyltransferase [Planctomycetota bacterium]
MNRYAKQILFAPLGKDGQERLGRSRVTIIGLGALGSTLANHLVRAGVGFVRLCDRDFVELDNLQRQVLYDEDDANAALPKAAAAAAKLARINSEVHLDPQVCDVNYANIEELAKDVDLVLDGTDNFETRFILNDACVKIGRPWIYGGCVGSYGMVMTVIPGEGPCFACLVGGLPAPGSSPTCDTAGVLNTAVSIVASLQANEAIKLLAGKKESLLGGLLTLDVWHNTQQLIRVPRSESCIACAKREFRHLEANPSGATSLCGRNAVQIVPPQGSSLDLAEAERRLSPLGKVRRNAYLLKLGVDGYELTLFPDARAIV